jgi:hypothetical protein
MDYIKDLFGLPKNTYYRYLKMISDSKILEDIHFEIISTSPPTSPYLYFITDTLSSKSMDGSDGVGRNPTDRGRNGILISLICDQDLVVHVVQIDKVNIHDSKLLEPTLKSSPTDFKKLPCLADSAYAGG